MFTLHVDVYIIKLVDKILRIESSKAHARTLSKIQSLHSNVCVTSYNNHGHAEFVFVPAAEPKRSLLFLIFLGVPAAEPKSPDTREHCNVRPLRESVNWNIHRLWFVSSLCLRFLALCLKLEHIFILSDWTWAHHCKASSNLPLHFLIRQSHHLHHLDPTVPMRLAHCNCFP